MKTIYKEGDLIGKVKFIKEIESKNKKQRRFIVACKCGKHFEAYMQHLKKEAIISCGCHKIRHHKTNTPEYKIWLGIKQRCFNPNSNGYKWYGGRGITMCERWKDSFENFLEDMGERPSNKHSIERGNSNGNYEPGNCSWETKKIQSNNTSRNVYITYNGSTKTAAQWSEGSDIDYFTLLKRIKAGWTIEKTFNYPAKLGNNQY